MCLEDGEFASNKTLREIILLHVCAAKLRGEVHCTLPIANAKSAQRLFPNYRFEKGESLVCMFS